MLSLLMGGGLPASAASSADAAPALIAASCACDHDAARSALSL